MAKDKVSPIPADELAGLVEAAPDNDLSRTGRDTTLVETNTVVEDRTETSAVEADVEYEIVESELAGGTILTSYGDVKAA